MSHKTRMKVRLNGTKQVCTLGWYGEANTEDIEDVIRKVIYCPILGIWTFK